MKPPFAEAFFMGNYLRKKKPRLTAGSKNQL